MGGDTLSVMYLRVIISTSGTDLISLIIYISMFAFQKKKIGTEVRIALMSVTLPPKDMCLSFHLASFLSHFLTMGS